MRGSQNYPESNHTRNILELKAAKNSTLKVVNVDYQDSNFVLSDGDEVSLFPPVQGG